jgi:hypothetical protein
VTFSLENTGGKILLKIFKKSQVSFSHFLSFSDSLFFWIKKIKTKKMGGRKGVFVDTENQSSHRKRFGGKDVLQGIPSPKREFVRRDFLFFYNLPTKIGEKRQKPIFPTQKN